MEKNPPMARTVARLGPGTCGSMGAAEVCSSVMVCRVSCAAVVGSTGLLAVASLLRRCEKWKGEGELEWKRLR